MSTSVDNSVNNGPQRLPPMSLTECNRCHNRVYFRARSSQPATDPHFKVEYLACPVCGNTATQLREVEILQRPAPTKRRVKYRYKS